MKKNHLKAILISLSLITALGIGGCAKKNVNKDILSTHDKDNVNIEAKEKETLNDGYAKPSSKEDDKKDNIDNKDNKSSASQDKKEKNPKFEFKDSVLKDDNSVVVYNEITSDIDNKKELNELIKNNVMLLKDELIKNKNTGIEIKGKIINSANNRITILYNGHYFDSNKNKKKLFASNTIDASSLKNLGLSDFATPDTLAEYIMSSSAIITDLDKDKYNKFKSELEKNTIEYYKDLLSKSDFVNPTELLNKVYSYEKDGDLYFTIPFDQNYKNYVTFKYIYSTK